MKENFEEQLLIYFASPYSHRDREVMVERFIKIKGITEQVIVEVRSVVPFSPIAYTHQFNHLEDVNWLEDIDFRYLFVCDAAIIVQMPGWASSEGVLGEKRFCQYYGIPLFYSEPDKVVAMCQEISDNRLDLLR